MLPHRVLFSLLGAGLCAVALASAAPARAELRIGYVDMQRALIEVAEGKQAWAELKAQFDAKQRQLDGKKTELESLKKKLEEQSLVVKDQARSQQAQQLQKKYLELQALYGMLQKELSASEMKFQERIIAKMRKIINEIAAREKFEIILNRGAVLVGPPSWDLTNVLIRDYDRKYPVKSAGAKKGKKKKGKAKKGKAKKAGKK